MMTASFVRVRRLGRPLRSRPRSCRRGRLAVALAAALLVCWGSLGLWCARADAWEGLSEPAPVGGPVGAVAAFGDQTWPAMACDSTGADVALVAWIDERSGDPEIYATRVNSDGERPDVMFFPVATGPGARTDPGVAWGNGTFLLTWVNRQDAKWNLEAARMTADGTLLDSDPILVVSADAAIEAPRAAFGSEDFLVAWSDARGGSSDIIGSRVSLDGEVLDPDGLLLAEGEGDQRTPFLAFDGDRYLLAWQRLLEIIEEDDTTYVGKILGQFVTPGGVPEDTTLVIEDVTRSALSPSVIFADSTYLVTWASQETENRVSIRGRFVATDGALAENKIEYYDSGTAMRMHPRVAFSGEQYLVTWARVMVGRTGMYGQRMSRTGELLDDREIEFDRVGIDRGEVVWLGENYFAAYGASDASGWSIQSYLIDTEGETVGDRIPISVGTPSQDPQCAGFDGTDYLLVWEEQTASGWRVPGIRVDSEGELVDNAATLIFPDTLDTHRFPSLAYGDDRYLVMWSEASSSSRSDVLAAFLDSAGKMTSDKILIHDRGALNCRPAISWSDGDFLVAWRFVNASGESEIMATHISEELGQPVADTLRAAGTGDTNPAIAYDGSADTHFIVWGRALDGVIGLFVTDEMWSESPGEEIRIATVDQPGDPRVIFDGSLYFTVWEAETSIYLGRNTHDGVALDPMSYVIADSTGINDSPALAFDGHNRTVVWRTHSQGRWQLVGDRLQADGLLASASPTVFSGDHSISSWPVFGTGDYGQLLFGYGGYLSEPSSGAMRLHTRIWRQDPPELTIGVHQNPGVTADVGIYVLSTEAIAPDNVDLRANGAPLQVAISDSANYTYVGWYQAHATREVNIVASVIDSVGNHGTALRSFAIGLIPDDEGGPLTGPFGDIVLSCAPEAVAGETFVMILPNEGWDRRTQESDCPQGFLLSPPGLVLKVPAGLSIRAARPPGAGAEVNCAVLERKTPDGWTAVPDQRWDPTGEVVASIGALGSFRLRWVADVEIQPVRLSLSLGPNPWRADLTIRYILPAAGPVELAIFDVNGRCVRTLAEGVQEGGRVHSLLWDGRDQGGRPAGTGVYFTRLCYGHEAVIRRSLLIR